MRFAHHPISRFQRNMIYSVIIFAALLMIVTQHDLGRALLIGQAAAYRSLKKLGRLCNHLLGRD